jgi:hypothetical protein
MDRSDVSEHFGPSWEPDLKIYNLYIFIFSSFMALPTCTHPIHSQPTYVRTLCTDIPHMYAPYTQTARVCLRK